MVRICIQHIDTNSLVPKYIKVPWKWTPCRCLFPKIGYPQIWTRLPYFSTLFYLFWIWVLIIFNYMLNGSHFQILQSLQMYSYLPIHIPHVKNCVSVIVITFWFYGLRNPTPRPYLVLIVYIIEHEYFLQDFQRFRNKNS